VSNSRRYDLGVILLDEITRASLATVSLVMAATDSVLIDDSLNQRPGSMDRSMLVLSCVIAFFNGILLTHVLAVFRLAIEAGTFLVVDVGRRIYPNLTIASSGCRGRGFDRSLGGVHARSSGSRSR
jgi:hypothetical protein